MASEELRGFAFRTDSGETIRVHDCICWRHLEGRPCRTASDREVAQTTDVVIIPVVPSGYSSSKRARKNALAGSATVGPLGGTDSNKCSQSLPVDRDALLSACTAAQAALEAAGLRATVDACPKQTPGAKYNAWENRGVPMRVEIGVREVAAGTFSLAVHPCLMHLVPAAAQAAAAAALGVQDARAAGLVAHEARSGSGDDSTPRVHASLNGGSTVQGARSKEGREEPAGAPGGRKPSLKLKLAGLGVPELVAACRLVSAAERDGTSPGASAAAPAATPRTGTQWCRKLHLWPDLVAAWGDTSAAVAALLAALAAAPPAGAGAGAGAMAPAAGAADGAVPCGFEGGDLDAAPRPRPRDSPQRPCVPHLRSLLQLGRACHCGRGHVSLQELREEVERRFAEAAGQRVAAWGPPPPPQAQAQQAQPVFGSGVGNRELPVQKNPQRPGRGPQRQQQQRQQQQRRGAAVDGLKERLGGGGDGDVGGSGAGPDGGSEEGSELGDGEGPGSGDPGDRAVLLVGNIPPAVKAASVQLELAAAFGPYGCQSVAVSRTRSGGSHGWARVALVATDVEATVAEAVRRLDGSLRLGGVPLTVSRSCGRLDTIFPYLPYAVRASMRVDSTAAFSATDQASADKTTDLLAGLAERLMIAPPEGPRGGVPPSYTQAEAQGQGPPPLQRQLGATVAQSKDGRLPSEEPSLTAAVQESGMAAKSGPAQSAVSLLPLSVTDGTACCGGNALSFARRFRRVTAVELDEDRAADLRHNAALVGAWITFKNRQQQEQHQQRQEGYQAGGASSNGSVSYGRMDVLCGDYTALKPGLSQDIVFLDPPWGGPHYAAAAAPQPRGRAFAADETHGGYKYGNTVFMLGEEPLSCIVAELLASGAAGMVALKLPSRADMELRAMQARVRQLVAARTATERSISSGGGALADGTASQGCPFREGRRGCCPRLLGAEVTLGRSALVLFLILPYRRVGGDAGDAAAEPSSSQAKRGGGLEGAHSAECGETVAAMPCCVGGDDGRGGEGSQSAGHDLKGGPEPGPGLPSWGHEEEDDDDDDEDDDEEEDEDEEGRSGASRAFKCVGRRGSRGGPPRGCPACWRLGPAFRAALRECCTALALQYRVVCD